jgi:hypothetical protein
MNDLADRSARLSAASRHGLQPSRKIKANCMPNSIEPGDAWPGARPGREKSKVIETLAYFCLMRLIALADKPIANGKTLLRDASGTPSHGRSNVFGKRRHPFFRRIAGHSR